MFWGDDVWGTLAPPARIVEPVARNATRPRCKENYKKIIMKPMISTLSMAFGHKKKHNPNNLARKHKENHYNWQFQLISMGGIGKKHIICRFFFGNNWGQGPEFATVTHAHAKLSGWVHYLASWWIFYSRDQPAGNRHPQFWCWKVRESSQKCPETIQVDYVFLEIEQWLPTSHWFSQHFCGWSQILWLLSQNTLGDFKKNEKQFDWV